MDKTVSNSLKAGGHHVAGRDKIWASEVKPSIMKPLVPRMNKWFHKHNIVSPADYETNSLNSIAVHQSLARMRPRTVESPALSVDSGGRSGNPSTRLAKGIKKLFNVEEGHYTEIYDRIDRHKPLTKRKPA